MPSAATDTGYAATRLHRVVGPTELGGTPLVVVAMRGPVLTWGLGVLFGTEVVYVLRFCYALCSTGIGSAHVRY